MGLILVHLRKIVRAQVPLLGCLWVFFPPLAEWKMKLSYNLVWQILDPTFDKHLKC